MTNQEKLSFLRVQKENIELKGMVLGSQLKSIDEQIAAVDANIFATNHPTDAPCGCEDLALSEYVDA